MTPRGHHDASRDEVQIRAWWSQHPNANIGISLEPSGLVVLDVDITRGKPGFESLAKIKGELTPTRVAQTGSGGAHLIYRVPEGTSVGRKCGFEPGLDLLGRGYVVVAPSRHVSGGVYSESETSPIAMLPSGLASRMVAVAERQHIAISDRPTFGPASAALIANVLDRLTEHGPAIQGENGDQHTYRAAAIARYDYALSPDETLTVLRAWNTSCRPPWSDHELRAKIGNADRYAQGEFGEARSNFEMFASFAGTLRNPAVTTAPPTPVKGPDRYVASLVDEIVALANQPFITTPYPLLNKALGDGLHRHTLTTITAGTGKGKTSFALALAAHHAAHSPTIFYVGEMTRALVGARLAAQQAGRPWGDALRGSMTRDDLLAVLSPLKLDLLKRSDTPIQTIQAAIHVALEESPECTPLVVIDYIQLLADTSEDLRLGTTDAVRYVQQLCEAYPIAMVALSQSSRGGASRIREGGGSAEEYADTGAESAALEQGSANVLVLSFKTADGANENDVTMMVAKARYRGPSKLGFRFNGATGRWSELSHPPLSAAETEREAAILFEVHAHANRSCGGGANSFCGRALNKRTLASKGSTMPHKVSGNADAIATAVNRLLERGTIKEFNGSLIPVDKR